MNKESCLKHTWNGTIKIKVLAVMHWTVFQSQDIQIQFPTLTDTTNMMQCDYLIQAMRVHITFLHVYSYLSLRLQSIGCVHDNGNEIADLITNSLLEDQAYAIRQ